MKLLDARNAATSGVKSSLLISFNTDVNTRHSSHFALLLCPSAYALPPVEESKCQISLLISLCFFKVRFRGNVRCQD